MAERHEIGASSQIPRIEFINHASVLISDGQSGLLSDPWYFGEAFHQGWALLVETPEPEIIRVLNRTSHIWISHEHPDHFSPPFFKKYAEIIRKRGITMLFQKTRDGRLVRFLRQLNLPVIELQNGQSFALNPAFSIRIVQSDLYDSALLADIAGQHIFNLNDCPIHDSEVLTDFARKYGQCDVLLTQFSYAAWKGGKGDIEWRKKAARHKLEAMHRQIDALAPKACVLFASFVRFSNRLNSYMNDAANHPDNVVAEQSRTSSRLIFMAPGETQAVEQLVQNPASLDFWREQYTTLPQAPLSSYPDNETVASLFSLFTQYQARLCRTNNRLLLHAAQQLLSIHPFGSTTVRLTNLDTTLRIDLLGKIEEIPSTQADIALHADSLAYIFRHEFGFDTLFVNACFEETAPGGFERFAKCFAIGNLNASGVYVRWSALTRLDVVSLMLHKLNAIRKNLNNKKSLPST